MNKVFLTIIATTFYCHLGAQSLYFPPLTGSAWDTLSPSSLGYCQARIDSLYAFLDANDTKAFLLLKDGKIVLEKYFGAHTQNTPWQWASAGKTITAFMTGIAQQEGLLSIADTTSDYLGLGWTSCTPEQEEKITIRHQLTMTTGLDDGYSDAYCTDDTCLVYKAEPGTRWAYHNGPYTLLDVVLENATGLTLNQYTAQRLKAPTGMTGAFVPVGYNNVYFSTARSMARFGLLILNKGNWNGQQIMTDTAYFQQMVSTSQQLNKSYGYLWWLNGKPSFMIPTSQFVFPGPFCPNAPDDMVAAIGKDGQLLNVVESQNLVWVRMGEAPSSTPVPFLLNDAIWQQLNALTDCNTTEASLRSDDDDPAVQLFPNPGTDWAQLKANRPIDSALLVNQLGQVVKRARGTGPELHLSLQGLPAGLYLLKLGLAGGHSWTGKLIKG